MLIPVIIDAIRTPVGALGGVLASVRPDDLAALVIKEVIQRNKLDPALIETDLLLFIHNAQKLVTPRPQFTLFLHQPDQ